MRYKQVNPAGATTYYVDKLMEIEFAGSAVDFRHYLGDVAILTKTGDLNDPTPGIKYFFRDRLGGVAAVGDDTGYLTENRGYDAYGKPRHGNWADKGTVGSSVTDRGFTDHEHLDDWELIHMNGRGFDYNLGRFLSIDPVIQAPGNSQSINPYSYIMNNPFAGLDPSGYHCQSSQSVGDCLDSVGAGEIAKIFDEGGAIVGVVQGNSDGSHTVTTVYNGGESTQVRISSESSESGGGPSRIDEINSVLDQQKAALDEQISRLNDNGRYDAAAQLGVERNKIQELQDRFAELRKHCSGSTRGCRDDAIDMDTIGQIARLFENLGMHGISSAPLRILNYELPIRPLSRTYKGANSTSAANPHKNSLDYQGETHVYVIRGPDGTPYKIGESAQGTRVRDGSSIRAEQQVRQLNRERGPGHTSEIRKEFDNKRDARSYETEVIERYRSKYGEETLPGNKTNR